MFWKTETNNCSGLRSARLRLFRKKTIPEPEMFHLMSRERRKWFRIRPAPEDPIVLRFDDREIHVRDIGAAGLSFDNTNDFSIGPLESCQLDLPEMGPALPVKLEIIAIDHRNVCHCEFNTIEEGAVERIHQYVLQRQKDILRKQKEQKTQNRTATDQTETDLSA